MATIALENRTAFISLFFQHRKGKQQYNKTIPSRKKKEKKKTASLWGPISDTLETQSRQRAVSASAPPIYLRSPPLHPRQPERRGIVTGDKICGDGWSRLGCRDKSHLSARGGRWRQVSRALDASA